MAQHHPELERAKAPAELYARVHQVLHRRRFDRLQVLGHERERLSNEVHPAAVERAQIERREQPLVRIDHERVGCARRHRGSTRSRAPSPRRRHRPRRRAARALSSQMSAIARTGSMLVVDVVPTVATTAIGRQPRRGPRRSRASSASGRMRNSRVRRDSPQRLVAEPEQDHGLVDRRVRVLGAVDAERVADRCGRRGRASARPGQPTSRAAASA